MQIIDFSEPRLAQEVHSLRRALAAAAVGNDFVRGIEFMHPAREFSERDEMPVEIANLVFVGLAHIQDEEIIAAVNPMTTAVWMRSTGSASPRARNSTGVDRSVRITDPIAS